MKPRSAVRADPETKRKAKFTIRNLQIAVLFYFIFLVCGIRQTHGNITYLSARRDRFQHHDPDNASANHTQLQNIRSSRQAGWPEHAAQQRARKPTNMAIHCCVGVNIHARAAPTARLASCYRVQMSWPTTLAPYVGQMCIITDPCIKDRIYGWFTAVDMHSHSHTAPRRSAAPWCSNRAASRDVLPLNACAPINGAVEHRVRPKARLSCTHVSANAR